MLHAQKEVGAAGRHRPVERFVQRFRYKKSKAKQAQAKLTQIDRLEAGARRLLCEVVLLSRKTQVSASSSS